MFWSRNRRRVAGRLPAFAVLALVVAAGTGCAKTGQHPVGDTGSTGPTPVLSGGADLQLPLDPYVLTPPQVDQVTAAHGALVAQCMRRFGLIISLSRATTSGPRTLNERRYGITDAEQARRAGYRLSDHEPSRPPAKTSEPAPDPVTLAVLKGEGAPTVHGQRVPEGGCYGEARRRLDEGAPTVTNPQLAQWLRRESFDKSQRDPRVQTVFRDWSACMKVRGLDYPGPLVAAEDRRFRGPVSAAEIATATADIDCKQKTNLVGVWFTVESGYQRPEIAANQDALDKIRRLNEAELKVAHDLGISSLLRSQRLESPRDGREQDQLQED